MLLNSRGLGGSSDTGDSGGIMLISKKIIDTGYNDAGEDDDDEDDDDGKWRENLARKYLKIT